MMADLAPGLYDMPSDAYLEDPCPEPSLDATVLRRLVWASPAHARAIHPRLGGQAPAAGPEADEGRALHALLLGEDPAIYVIDAPDWRSAAARSEREAARARGETPLLRPRAEVLVECAQAARRDLRRVLSLLAPGRVPLDGPIGRTELTVIWRERCWCRGRLDLLVDGGGEPAVLVEIKTTSRLAGGLARDLVSEGHLLQVAWYRRGLRAVRGERYPVLPVLVAVEREAPYGVLAYRPTAEALAWADAWCDWAVGAWAECLRLDSWPGYLPLVRDLEVPPWLLAQPAPMLREGEEP